MSAFLLSPGITPELTDLFVIEFPIALGLGYVLGRRAGFEFAFVLNALVLGTVKLVTDYADVWDDAVSLAAVLGGVLWIGISRNWPKGAGSSRGTLRVLGVVFVIFGVLKVLNDFYDPFDLLLADCAIVAGIAVAFYPGGKRDDPVAPWSGSASSSRP